MPEDPLRNLTKHQLAAASETYERLKHLIEKLPGIQEQLANSTHRILTHIAEGDISDHNKNSAIWHDLYNAAHKLHMFHDFSRDELEKYHRVLNDLITLLSDTRPSVKKLEE